MKAKTPGKVIAVLKDHIAQWKQFETDSVIGKAEARHHIACLDRAIGIVRLWDAGITPADVRKAERNRKGRAKKCL